MDSIKNEWRLGELVNLPRSYSQIKKGRTSFEHVTGSRYICIRESSKGQRGVLMKVLGKTFRNQIKVICGEPFCKDDKFEGFDYDIYYSFRFPTTDELKEVLAILRGNADLLAKFEAASMHINPYSTFWVRETAPYLLFMKQLQYYDSKTEASAPSSGNDEEARYRITIAYF